MNCPRCNRPLYIRCTVAMDRYAGPADHFILAGDGMARYGLAQELNQ